MKKGDLITHPSDTRRYRTPSQKFDDEIRAWYRQMKERRERRYPIYRNKKSSNANSTNGRWVTIDGNHVFIES